ncbi:hypothetical protein ACFC09_30310 [Streptomyces sp. NPDC056161]|uniref:hypothetical protein n=1 Tax=Streptomyces sp. NPDC056161 TaxID=3345732 RepID=UPI0035D62E12
MTEQPQPTDAAQTPLALDRPPADRADPAGTVPAQDVPVGTSAAQAAPVQDEAVGTAPGQTTSIPDASIPDAPGAPPKDRRVLRAVLRWTAAVAVFAAVGTGTAYGITRMERTDVPGLATEQDGRWPYPEISAAPLPPGKPGPLAPTNMTGSHYADLRKLVLPAPGGAKADKALRGTDGWLATRDFLALYGTHGDRAKVGQLLTDYGLRHIAARGWTTEDGTRTGIYLLQFDTATAAEEVLGDITEFDSPVYAARGAAETLYDEGFPSDADVSGVTRLAYDEVKPYGAAQVRQAYLGAGDVVGVVVQSRPGRAAAVPFQQTVALQSQLLG